MVIIQAQTILLERGVWGSSPRKILLELVQNPAILDNSGGGGTPARYYVTIREENAHFEKD